MAAPTLTINAAGKLQILDGTSGDPVTNNDVWDWDDGGGSSGGDGDIPVDGGGTVKVSSQVTEVVADAMYQYHNDVQLGDGSTPTYVKSVNEMVHMPDYTIEYTAAATFELGDKSTEDDESGFGSTWHIKGSTMSAGAGTFICHNSYIHYDGASLTFSRGTVHIYRTSFVSTSGNWGLRFVENLGTSVLNDIYIYNVNFFTIRVATITAERVTVDTGTQGFSTFNSDATITDLLVRNISSEEIFANLGDITLINPRFHPSTVRNVTESDSITEQYTFDIFVVDEAGADLAGVTCLVKDQFDATVFSADTDGNGVISQQIADAKLWEGTDEDLTTYSPLLLTLSKTGYETQIIPAITLNELKNLQYTLLPDSRRVSANKRGNKQ